MINSFLIISPHFSCTKGLKPTMYHFWRLKRVKQVCKNDKSSIDGAMTQSGESVAVQWWSYVSTDNVTVKNGSFTYLSCKLA